MLKKSFLIDRQHLWNYGMEERPWTEQYTPLEFKVAVRVYEKSFLIEQCQSEESF